jgi:hypothetical protein
MLYFLVQFRWAVQSPVDPDVVDRIVILPKNVTYRMSAITVTVNIFCL